MLLSNLIPEFSLARQKHDVWALGDISLFIRPFSIRLSFALAVVAVRKAKIFSLFFNISSVTGRIAETGSANVECKITTTLVFIPVFTMSFLSAIDFRCTFGRSFSSSKVKACSVYFRTGCCSIALIRPHVYRVQQTTLVFMAAMSAFDENIYSVCHRASRKR